MATELVGLARGDRLGYPAYYRAVLEAGTLSFGDGDFRLGLGRWWAGFADTDMVQPVNQPQPIAGDRVAVVDLATDPRGQANTVSDLAELLNGFTHLVRVRSLEKVSKTSAYDKGASSRDAATQDAAKEQRSENPLVQLAGATKWVGIGIILVALAVLVWQGRTLARSLTP